MIEQTVYNQISSLAGGRVYPYRIPEEELATVVYPAIEYRVLGDPVLQTQEKSFRHPRFRFEVWATSWDEMVTVASQIIAAIDHNSALHALFIGETDIDDRRTAQVAVDTGLFHRVLEFYMWE